MSGHVQPEPRPARPATAVPRRCCPPDPFHRHCQPPELLRRCLFGRFPELFCSGLFLVLVGLLLSSPLVRLVPVVTPVSPVIVS